MFWKLFEYSNIHTARKIPFFMNSFSGNYTASVLISTFMCLWAIYIFACSRIDRRSWKYINLSQIYECRNCETEHYNSVLEMTASFLGIHKWEPDIYIGFSSALHLKALLRRRHCCQDDEAVLFYWHDVDHLIHKRKFSCQTLWLRSLSPSSH